MPEVNILLVEDDDIDVKNLKRCFQTLKIANPLYEAKDGIQALEMLRGTKESPPIPKPWLVLLDLNMPRMNGLEFLKELRSDPDLRRTVVFVMTTSSAEEDRVGAYNYNVAGYVLKQSPGQTFIDAVTMLEHYWRIVELPDKE